MNIAGIAVLLVLLRRRVGRIHFGEIAASSWRIVVAAAVAGAAAFGVWYGLDDVLGRGLLGQLVSVGVASPGRGGVYIARASPPRPRARHAPLAERPLPPRLTVRADRDPGTRAARRR